MTDDAETRSVSDRSDTVTPPADTQSSGWSFYKHRFARVLLIAGVALVVVQFLPAIPSAHRVEVRAPAERSIVTLRLSYASAEDGEVMGGTELHPPWPTSSLTHEVVIKNGSYQFDVSAEVTTANRGATRWINQVTTLKLADQPGVIALVDPEPPYDRR